LKLRVFLVILCADAGVQATRRFPAVIAIPGGSNVAHGNAATCG